MSQSNFEWVFTPSKFDEGHRPLVLKLAEWDKALKFSRQCGYAPPESGGMTRDAARSFSQGLRDAVRAGQVPDAEREWVDRLVGFLEGDARGGFTQARRWMSWRAAK